MLLSPTGSTGEENGLVNFSNPFDNERRCADGPEVCRFYAGFTESRCHGRRVLWWTNACSL